MNRAPLLVPLVTLFLLAGCGSSSSSSSGPATSPAATTPAPAGGGGGGAQVTMKNLAFKPSSVSAKVGETVQWVNDDTAPHNVTYVSGPKFTSSSTLSTGGKFQLKLTQAGTIHYFCSIHPFMKATIVVTK